MCGILIEKLKKYNEKNIENCYKLREILVDKLYKNDENSEIKKRDKQIFWKRWIRVYFR